MEITSAEGSAHPQGIERLQRTEISGEESSSCMTLRDDQEILSSHPMQGGEDEQISDEAQYSSRNQPAQTQVHKFPLHYVSEKPIREMGKIGQRPTGSK